MAAERVKRFGDKGGNDGSWEERGKKGKKKKEGRGEGRQ